ncbi:MAG: MBL fold metallo-hydrolase [Flavipsychrobacter sp.]
MKIEQIYTGCLAQGAYYVESNGEAVIIDPLREVDQYVQKANTNGAAIKYIFETHFHADFVSGHIDLADKTGAAIVYGPNADPSFPAVIAKDKQRFKVGGISFEVWHTPGHTMESTCYLLRDETDKPVALFSGDTLCIGDVGRPVLAQQAAQRRQVELAGLVYDSTRKLMALPDDVIVYPAHGAGSACGKNMSKETYDTLGHQKEVNYALRKDMTKQEFIKEVTTGLMPPPGYFAMNVTMNKQGYESIDVVLARGQHELNPETFEAAANETQALILDTRAPEDFVKGFIPNSVNIGIDGNFAPWVGALITDIKQPLLIVADEGREEEVVTRLARVGYDNAIGFLKGGFNTWKAAGKEVDYINTITDEELASVAKIKPVNILDVRKNSEYLSEHVADAENLPLDYINNAMQAIDKDKQYYVHCASGYRSVIFISILKSRGYEHLVNVVGGFKALKAGGRFPVTDYVCPTTLL